MVKQRTRRRAAGPRRIEAAAPGPPGATTSADAPATPDPHAECALEPIHIPGAVQPHGAVLALDPADLVVVQASANLGAVLGVPAADALGRTAPEVLGEEGWRRMRAMLRTPDRSFAGAPPRIATRGPGSAAASVVATASRSPCGRICLELEPRAEERGQGGGWVTRRLVPMAQTVVAILTGARSTTELAVAAVRELRRITGHERVIMYRFDRDGHGEVMAEEREASLQPYLGLRYPASDVPAQARLLYLAKRLRVIPDAAAAPVPLLGLEGRAGPPLDMTHCGLRAVSPVHLEYLANMGVRATLVVSLTGSDGSLWGMLVGHDRRPHPVPAELRVLADLVGQIVSVLLTSLGESESIALQLARERTLRALAAALADPGRPIAEALTAPGVAEELLRAADAAGAAMRIGGRFALVGTTPPHAEAEALMDALAPLGGGAPYATDATADAVPDAADRAADRAATAAGALVVPLAHGQADAIAWFRPELRRTVAWGGNPHAPPERDPRTGRLSPRRSFAIWREEVRGRSAEWTTTDLAAAREVRRLLADAFLRRTEAELARLRHNDPLTGLPNRRLLQERLEALDSGAAGDRAALIYVDLDRFKQVNDSLGHDAGDALLVQIAARLRAALDPDMLVARIGGDEFAILCEGVAVEAAEATAARVRAVLEPPFDLVGRPYRATASVGVAHSATTGLSGGALLQAADAAMYVAKRSGGDGAARFVEPLRVEAVRRLALEQDLRATLDAAGGGLLLEFQPIVALATGRLAGLEALARWRHPERGLVPPGEFVPIAEEAGLIAALGEWVLEAALNEAVHWAEVAAGGLAPYVTVNLSPRQCAAGDAAERILAALAARGLPGRALRIEVTEAAMADGATTRALVALRAAGVAIAIDDFGTGYSSLSYLARLPADVVKLDRSFLPGVGGQFARRLTSEEGFMGAVVAVARHAGLEVVCEGVETPAQLLAVAAAGAGAVQGFLLARPMGAEAALDLIRRTAAGGEAPPWAALTGPLAPLLAGGATSARAVTEPAFLHMVQSLDEAVMVTDAPAGGAEAPHILSVNAALERLTGYPAADLLGRSPGMLQGPGTDKESRAALSAALRAGRAVEACLLNYRRDGTPFRCAMRILPLRDPSGAVTHFVGLLREAPPPRPTRRRRGAASVEVPA